MTQRREGKTKKVVGVTGGILAVHGGRLSRLGSKESRSFSSTRCPWSARRPRSFPCGALAEGPVARAVAESHFVVTAAECSVEIALLTRVVGEADCAEFAFAGDADLAWRSYRTRCAELAP